jgi:hypothetical protein
MDRIIEPIVPRNSAETAVDLKFTHGQILSVGTGRFRKSGLKRKSPRRLGRRMQRRQSKVRRRDRRDIFFIEFHEDFEHLALTPSNKWVSGSPPGSLAAEASCSLPT